MANRMFNQYAYGLERMPVNLFANVAIGTSGAATIDASKSLGVASIARDGSTAGKYTITLADKYQRLMDLKVTFMHDDAAPAAPFVYVISEDVDGDKTIVIQCLDGDTPAATDPGDGETMLIHLTLANC